MRMQNIIKSKKEYNKCTFQPVVTQRSHSLTKQDNLFKNSDVYVRNQDWLNIKKIKNANLRIKYTNNEYTFKPIITSLNIDKKRNKETKYDNSTLLYFERLQSVFNKKNKDKNKTDVKFFYNLENKI